DAAITTDLIVGFPGETEEDFQETLDVVAAARFSSAFTFQYSSRPGTPAADLPGHLPKAVVQERYERLTTLQEQISGEVNARQVGRTVEVLIGEGEGRKDGATHRLTGRAADNSLVHLAVPPGAGLSTAVDQPDPRSALDVDPLIARPGDLVTVEVTRSAPHHLVADSALLGGAYAVRRTRAGDAWAARERDRTSSHSHAGTGGAGAVGAAIGGAVTLGMPTLRR
ncbi:MAG TPA: tRNA (N6-isopentenyl adenosine(37)-C2)-methylthiotransferase MiaB, partial [Actinotalea sp.]